jgi:hypothetical protein
MSDASRSDVLDELRGMIRDDTPISDAALLCGAAKLIEQLDKEVAVLREEVAAMRRGADLAADYIEREMASDRTAD